jgi:tyrosyl-tRNA synthetase
VRDFLSTLRARGFLHQTTDDENDAKPFEKLQASTRVTGYVGFDPTAPSLHVGSLVPIMGLRHLQDCGHRPVVVLGGGTGMVGDPSGKTELRKLLLAESIEENVRSQREQFSRYLQLQDSTGSDDASDDHSVGLVVNNAEWLTSLGYVDFLREIGRHFSVNRMLSAESVKLRLDSDNGLSFLEFNYMLLQAYDFLLLHRRYGCTLQMGASDQWGNIVAGVDLIRRVEGSDQKAHGVTFPLLTMSSGKKMGKSEAGAVWLDPARTSPYEFYQYWVNVDDPDVGRFLRMFTLLSLEEIEVLDKLEGADIREAKQVLAYEATRLTHGEEEAKKARDGARSVFQGAGDGSNVPTYSVAETDLAAGLLSIQVFADAGLCDSKSAARRMARQNGLYVNGESIAEDHTLTSDQMNDGVILLRVGKKKHRHLVVGDA